MGLVLTGFAFERKSHFWLWLVGAGVGGIFLTQDEIRKFPNQACIYDSHGGFECPAAAAHEIFWFSLVVVAVGVVVGLIQMVRSHAARQRTI